MFVPYAVYYRNVKKAKTNRFLIDYNAIITTFVKKIKL